MRWLPVLALVLVSHAPVPAAAAAPDLAELIRARLELMDEVAAYKWRRGLPVEDRARERVVVRHAVEAGLRQGVTPDSSRTFFEAQIEAAKAIQRHWFAVWEGSAGPGEAPDLEGEIRPRLLELGSAILEAAARGPAVRARDVEVGLDVAGLTDAARAELARAAAALERYPDRLAQILDTGTLRVGTTGDYPPFSHRADDAGTFSGIDVDLARDLAAELGVEAVFVETSWPTLMADLAAGRFDIGMSGISRILERQKSGHLSRPYHVGGKTPIARCEAADRFATLAAIDRPEVRVVVNPGGTNERFVDAELRHARKQLHPDNRTIFEELVENRADVMITDRIEARLQADRHPALCLTMTGTLTYQEKSYLMPPDPRWNAFVDTWLALALADGTVADTFAAHGAGSETDR